MIVPLKKFDYDTWLRVAARNNAKRAELGLSLWSGADTHALYSELFPTRS